MIALRAGVTADIDIFERISPNDEPGYFARCLGEGRIVLLASSDGMDCGCAQLNFNPRYSLYRKLDYPEIQDVAVLPEYRNRGIATSMIAHLEKIARDQGHQGIGISVGVTREFGAAQRLYFKLGYVPDGFGVTYDRTQVDGARLYAPDGLCLMLLKEFPAAPHPDSRIQISS